MLSKLNPHVFYLVVIALGVVGFRSWLTEHDLRVKAEEAIKANQTQIVALQGQIKTTTDAAQKQVQVVVKTVQAIKTPQQAIATIPDLSTLPLNSRPIPDAPDKVAVDAIPLVQELASCKETTIELGACQANSLAKDKIIADQTQEITALKRKPEFWHRVWADTKKITVGVGIGLALSHI